jgi:hypothetical protein
MVPDEAKRGKSGISARGWARGQFWTPKERGNVRSRNTPYASNIQPEESRGYAYNPSNRKPKEDGLDLAGMLGIFVLPILVLTIVTVLAINYPMALVSISDAAQTP